MNQPSAPTPKRHIALITGMSGAGLSTALKAFEDLGYETIDNLRLSLIPALLDPIFAPGKSEASLEAKSKDANAALAVAIDTRNADFSVEGLLQMHQQFTQKPGYNTKLLYLECSDEGLQRRFTETRRRHPLALDRPVTDGIRREREMLWRLRDAADHVIDTSLISIHELRRLVAGHYRIDNEAGLTIFVTSFSYRHGVPREADLVFDTRFLANPHWDPELRSLTGKDENVAAYIRKDPDYVEFTENIIQLLLPLLPRYQQEGKSYLTIAVGCTGGRHRSVMIAEELATMLAAQGYITGIGHRDLDRGATNKP